MTDACKSKDEEELREAAGGLVKCRRIMQDKYGRKEYMRCKTLQEVRNIFYGPNASFWRQL